MSWGFISLLNELRSHGLFSHFSGTVKAVGDRGLRLIELRSLPEGVVFHHWEFLQEHPPAGKDRLLRMLFPS